ncbi:HEPN domain-containing protein [Dyadobacter sp. CY312]|uniref:HEPN domain-containing protein n=1 Tax=Dyadobacter sp. CY312 TaxID=2907303 RepID=UPI001F1DEB83|nr:HEPN domain-containing protein [Dyadobacter sp. CY312]
MELNGHILSEDQQHDLSGIVEAICHKFEIEHIFLFGFRQAASADCSCFATNHYAEFKAYCILVVTHTRQGQQHTIQDFLNHQFPDLQITVLSHWSGQVGKLLADGNRFLGEVFKTGLLLKTSDGYNTLSYDHSGTPAQYHEDARQYFIHHSAVSKGFLASARQRFIDQDFKLCLFLLHQAMEQSAIGLIRVWMGYRYNIHHLSRLLALCCYFSPKIPQIFTNSKQDQILLQKLNRAYLDTRYQNDFHVTAHQAEALLKKVEVFKDVSDALCSCKLASLQEQTNMVATL